MTGDDEMYRRLADKFGYEIPDGTLSDEQRADIQALIQRLAEDDQRRDWENKLGE